jgi:hypothetical protein
MKDAKTSTSIRSDSLWAFYAKDPTRTMTVLITDNTELHVKLSNEETKYRQLKEIATALRYEHDTDHLNAPKECKRCNALNAYDEFFA